MLLGHAASSVRGRLTVLYAAAHGSCPRALTGSPSGIRPWFGLATVNRAAYVPPFSQGVVGDRVTLLSARVQLRRQCRQCRQRRQRRQRRFGVE